MNADPPPARESEPRPVQRPGSLRDIRTALSIIGPLLFLPPVLALADRDFTVFGVPALIVYVFSVWLGGIVLIALLARRGEAD